MIELDRVLITGGSGMVGSQIPFGVRPSHAEFDIANKDSVVKGFEAFKPAAVINLAGLVDMSLAEMHPEEAERLNVEGAKNIADACAQAKIPLVHFSTCAVFDGSKETPYVESDKPNPLNVYGLTKYRGEQEVLSRAPSSLVVRTGWLFGGSRDKKFIHNFIHALKEGRAVRAVDDRFGSPTYIPDLIPAVAALLQLEEQGIVHVVNSGISSYFQVAQEIHAILGSGVSVEGVSAHTMDLQGIVRGRMEGLISERGIILRPYKEALKEYIAL